MRVNERSTSQLFSCERTYIVSYYFLHLSERIYLLTYLEDKMTERYKGEEGRMREEKEKSTRCFTPQIITMAGSVPCWSQEPGPLPRSSVWQQEKRPSLSQEQKNRELYQKQSVVSQHSDIRWWHVNGSSISCATMLAIHFLFLVNLCSVFIVLKKHDNNLSKDINKRNWSLQPLVVLSTGIK